MWAVGCDIPWNIICKLIFLQESTFWASSVLSFSSSTSFCWTKPHKITPVDVVDVVTEVNDRGWLIANPINCSVYCLNLSIAVNVHEILSIGARNAKWHFQTLRSAIEINQLYILFVKIVFALFMVILSRVNFSFRK